MAALLRRVVGNSRKHQLGNLGSVRFLAEDSKKYCLDLVRTHDYAHYLAGMFLKGPARESYFAIRAFNVEVSRIRESVNNNVLTGKMRVQWWRDILTQLYNNNPSSAPEHPVARELAVAIHTHSLTRRWLDRLLEARDEELEVEDGSAPESLPWLENYAEQSSSSALYLGLECVGVRDLHADHAASHVGKATGLVNALRSMPFLLPQQRMPLPTDLLHKHSLSPSQLFRGGSAALPDMPSLLAEPTFELASAAHSHLSHARDLADTVPAPARPVLLPAVDLQLYLDALQGHQFNTMHPSLLPSAGARLRLQWGMWRAAMAQTF